MATALAGGVPLHSPQSVQLVTDVAAGSGNDDA
jgi:hypothetical protein